MITQLGAKVHVTKIAAAERQLRTAIRMFFADEDELSHRSQDVERQQSAWSRLTGFSAHRQILDPQRGV